MADPAVSVKVDVVDLKRKLKRLTGEGLLNVREAAGRRVAAVLPEMFAMRALNRRFGVPGLLPQTRERKMRDNSPFPGHPLVDRGYYTGLWTATVSSSRGAGWSVSVIMRPPAGATESGLSYEALAMILEHGTTRSVPRPHIEKFARSREVTQLVRTSLMDEVNRAMMKG